ncbi:MAG: ABC transporter permease [Alphaproteobacteria bacterium]|nr:ABC transporter permease [Alphaproteobacteria bacterium]
MSNVTLARKRLPGAGIPWRWLVPAVLLAIIVLSALLADILAPHDPNKQNLANFLSPPSAEHWMGTDALGRDVMSRMMYGARISLLVGVSSVGLALLIGVVLGITSAMVGGWIGEAIMRLTDLLLTLPPVLIALAVAATVGPSLPNVIMVIALLYWAQFARMVRGEALSIRERDYVQAAYAIGCGNTRLLWKHILPNLVNTVIVLATLQIAGAILLESTLSFLGVGVPPPTPTWGTMVADGRPYVELGWWMVTFPGLGIMVAVLSINLLGDVLRDKLDPKFVRRS